MQELLENSTRRCPSLGKANLLMARQQHFLLLKSLPQEKHILPKLHCPYLSRQADIYL